MSGRARRGWGAFSLGPAAGRRLSPPEETNASACAAKVSDTAERTAQISTISGSGRCHVFLLDRLMACPDYRLARSMADDAAEQCVEDHNWTIRRRKSIDLCSGAHGFGDFGHDPVFYRQAGKTERATERRSAALGTSPTADGKGARGARSYSGAFPCSGSAAAPSSVSPVASTAPAALSAAAMCG